MAFFMELQESMYFWPMRLQMAAIFVALSWAQTTHPNRAYVRLSQAPFLHGVASGDPTQNSVVLWTRINPPQNWTGSISVAWQVATDTSFSTIVASGNTTTDADRDYTVKVLVTGLQADRWYYYRFSALSTNSVIGRTRTLPANPTRIRFAVVSCADYQNGFYTAYENISLRNDVDFILHLGDYIYEYGPASNDVRQSEPPKEILTLEDYRIRYSHYRLDSSLQWLHQNFPFIVVWDDHELADNTWKAGAQNHDPNTEGSFAARKAAMLRAYHEWLPFWMPDPNDSLRLWRNFSFGSLADLMILDTRQYDRDQQVPANSPNLNAPNRSMLGLTQRDWLLNQLGTATATWKLLGQQVMMAPFRAFGTPLNTDQWDGYPAERETLMTFLKNYNIGGVVVLTGDIHTSWANDLPFGPGPYNSSTGAGSTAVEFVTPSITSANASFLGTLANPALVKSQNPHVKYVDLTRHGYLIMTIVPDSVQGDWFFTNRIDQPIPGETAGESWYVRRPERFLRKASAPISVGPGYNPPLIPRQLSTSLQAAPRFTLVGVYPNPAQQFVTLQIHTAHPLSLTIRLVNALGQTIATYSLKTPSAGTHYYQVPLEGLSEGLFFLEVASEHGKQSYQLLKR